MTNSARPTLDEVVEDLRRRAVYMRSEALRLETLANSIEKPPEGIRVEFAGAILRFVGPLRETNV